MKDLILKISEISHLSREGHVPSSLSILDILYVFYKTRPDEKMILSKGHAALGLYAVLDHFGLLKNNIDDFCKFGSGLGGHPTDKIENVVASTGSLGHGLPIGLGMALGYKIKKSDSKVYVIVGDGECNEGTIWECALLASHHRLNNLVCIVDYNHSGDRALGLGDLSSKFVAFGWDVVEIDGHDHSQIEDSLNHYSEKPILILANTIKGKGLDFMENNPEWHHKSPSEEDIRKIISKL